MNSGPKLATNPDKPTKKKLKTKQIENKQTNQISVLKMTDFRQIKSSVACVQTRLVYRNRIENLISVNQSSLHAG